MRPGSTGDPGLSEARPGRFGPTSMGTYRGVARPRGDLDVIGDDADPVRATQAAIALLTPSFDKNHLRGAASLAALVEAHDYTLAEVVQGLILVATASLRALGRELASTRSSSCKVSPSKPRTRPDQAEPPDSPYATGPPRRIGVLIWATDTGITPALQATLCPGHLWPEPVRPGTDG